MISKPIPESLLLTVGAFNALMAERFNSAMISLGVFAGATRAAYVVKS